MSDDTYLITADEIEAIAGIPTTHFLNKNCQTHQ